MKIKGILHLKLILKNKTISKHNYVQSKVTRIHSKLE